MDDSHLRRLPDELLEAIVFHLPPAATVAFGTTCKRANKIAYEHLVWRRHCMLGWRHWDAEYEIQDKLQQPPAQTKWRHLYNERRRTDNQASESFDLLLQTQQHRVQRIENVSKLSYNVKDLLLRLRDQTPDDAEDVLARRYYADAILGQVHRMTAIEKWSRLHNRQMVRLEEVLGAYDLFVLAGRKGDLRDIDEEFDRIANAIRQRDPDFDDLSTRQKAIQIAKWLRSESLVGNPSESDYHALRNNFISMALFDEVHTSLPLQSVAIYCAVARRLGVNAKPSNYPHHVHAVIEAPTNRTLDGKFIAPVHGVEDNELMHMDPWRSSDETPRVQLTTRLTQMGIPTAMHGHHLGATTNFEIALRTGRNIMNSVQEARDQHRGVIRTPLYPDPEAAWYSMLWAMLILGDSNAAAALHRRRQCLPYLAEHFQSHFPEDLSLLESIIAPMFEKEREHHILMHLITRQRTADRNAKAPSPRPAGVEDNVLYKIGHAFTHARYRYEGIIVGWDFKCSAEPQWIQQMRVDDLPRGREQPFYNVVADDKSLRYVAEENISRLYEKPCDILMALAGKYFKRWDDAEKIFVSNIRDEYPDD